MRNHIKKNTDPELKFYSVKEVGQILGLSKNATYRLIHTAGFPVVKVGGEYRVSESAIKLWLKRLERGVH